MAAHGGSELEQGEIDVAGVRRSYWLARAPRWPGRPAPPLLIALHGSGLGGKGMASFTGLAARGPAAGITVVFPDGWQQAWHPVRPPDAEPKLDDARFLSELATHLEGLGAASSWPVFLTGLSQGARFAEHIARHGLLPVTGLFLVAGTALECSRRLSPAPQLRVSMTLVTGTADRTAPYEGGPLGRRGLSGARMRRRTRTWDVSSVGEIANQIATDLGLDLRQERGIEGLAGRRRGSPGLRKTPEVLPQSPRAF